MGTLPFKWAFPCPIFQPYRLPSWLFGGNKPLKTVKKRALLLVNKKARRGSEAIDALVGRLHRGGLDLTVEPFENLPEIARDIVRLRNNTDMVVLCGGDGTIASGAMAVGECGLPLGIMPMGTANDLARTLGIPMDLGAAADVILAGKTRKIDIGHVNGFAFFNVASIGLSAELAQGLHPELKKRFGRFGYAVAAAKVLMKAKPFTAIIRDNGQETRVKTFQIAIGNGRLYGGGNVVEESAEIDDGHLDLYSLEMGRVWKLAGMLRSFRSGTLGAWKEVRTARDTEFEIETKRPMPVNADGEIVTSTPAKFVVHPGAITVFAPDKGSSEL
ncbi:MAG: lipid kinase [Rhizobiaceae bacterium]|nr:lipid kinase [Rhizobiaceae bacterium]